MTTSVQRVLALEGACNLRDLGGYRTRDGRSIRPGLLFRSGVMSYFTENDHPHLTRLALRTICDLRRADERDSEPTRWPTDIRITVWPEDPHAPLDGLPLDKLPDEASTRQRMIEFYRLMPRRYRRHLQGLLRCLIGGEVPLLFHCAAGKDRTGLSAAIVLHTLGVPVETIYEDYELTNRAVDLHAFMLKHQRARLGLSDGKHPLETMDAGVRRAMLAADKAYLAAALAQIETDHGSVENYVRDILGVSDREREQMRALLLTD